MPIFSLAIGGLLIVLGVAGYVSTGQTAPTALIPAAFGLIFEICGFLAMRPPLRKHAMHAAAALALIGLLATINGIPQAITLASGGSVLRPAASISKAMMAVLMVIFLIMAVRSFMQARRERVAQGI